MGRNTKNFRQTRRARVADRASTTFGNYQRMEPYGPSKIANQKKTQ